MRVPCIMHVHRAVSDGGHPAATQQKAFSLSLSPTASVRMSAVIDYARRRTRCDSLASLCGPSSTSSDLRENGDKIFPRPLSYFHRLIFIDVRSRNDFDMMAEGVTKGERSSPTGLGKKKHTIHLVYLRTCTRMFELSK